MAVNGADVLVLVNTGTEQTPVWTVVGSQRNATVDEATEVIDISSKEKRARRILPGRYSSTLNLDGLYVPDDTAYGLLQSAMRNGTYIQVMIQKENEQVESASGVVTSLSREYPDQGESTVTITIEIDGEWTPVVLGG